MHHVLQHLRIRPRLSLASAVGLAAAAGLPGDHSALTRGLLGWNLAVWLYLALVAWMMLRGDHRHLRRVALAQAQGATTVLSVVVVASLVSLVGIVLELQAAKALGASNALPHVAMALITVAGAWLLVPTMFTLTYASVYWRTPQGQGLRFPQDEDGFRPDYHDFLYFAFTIAVASQTADVSVTSQTMRRLVLLQAVLSFVFNTAILALTINIAASLF
jgi:uncharacterized membrane protein